MAIKGTKYPAEFRRQMVELVWAGRKFSDLSREFGPTDWTIRKWVKQAAALAAGYNYDLNDQIRFGLSTGPGLYERDRFAPNLGSSVEFLSTIELSLRVYRRQRFAVAFGHISNAHLAPYNPGAELVEFLFNLSLSKRHWEYEVLHRDVVSIELMRQTIGSVMRITTDALRWTRPVGSIKTQVGNHGRSHRRRFQIADRLAESVSIVLFVMMGQVEWRGSLILYGSVVRATKPRTGKPCLRKRRTFGPNGALLNWATNLKTGLPQRQRSTSCLPQPGSGTTLPVRIMRGETSVTILWPYCLSEVADASGRVTLTEPPACSHRN